MSIAQYFVDNFIPEIPGIYEEYMLARNKYFYSNEKLSRDELLSIIAIGAHRGAIIRIAYWKFVRNGDSEPFEFWNEVIKHFIFNNTWFIDLKTLIKNKENQKIIKKMRHPDWVEIGLCGTDWSKLRKKCEEFCDYMETLED